MGQIQTLFDECDLLNDEGVLSTPRSSWAVFLDEAMPVELKFALASRHTRHSAQWGEPVWPRATVEQAPPTGNEPQTQGNTEYEQQKQAFEAIPPKVLARYHGRFVVSRNGRIVDSDHDLVTLGRRFFGKNGDVPAYITKVGGPIEIRIRTPFVK
jgi:hypothetical protein